MLTTGILNPAVLSLLARVPTVRRALRAIRSNFVIGEVFMAEEFRRADSPATQDAFARALDPVPLTHYPHQGFKKRVPDATGLIRTGDTLPSTNMILVSA